MSEYDFRNERVIGHSVMARKVDHHDRLPDGLRKILEKNGEGQRQELIEVVEGDVDWEDSRKVRLSKKEIARLYEKYVTSKSE